MSTAKKQEPKIAFSQINYIGAIVAIVLSIASVFGGIIGVTWKVHDYLTYVDSVQTNSQAQINSLRKDIDNIEKTLDAVKKKEERLERFLKSTEEYQKIIPFYKFQKIDLLENESENPNEVDQTEK
jgi:hypothetical protein